MFMISLMISNTVIADVDALLNQEQIPDFSPITSLSTLTSLKNIKNNQLNQTPFVQDIPSELKVRTLFVETHDLPIIDLQLTFNAGSAQDLNFKGISGTANMAAKLLFEGTDQYTAKQLISTFNHYGAKVSATAHRDMFIIRLRVLSDPQKLDPALNLLLHVIQKSNFNQSGLNLVVSNTQIGQKQIQENPSRLMSVRFYRDLYGKHPYAEPSVGTQGSIKKINPELLQEFRDQYLVAQNTNIAITGDLSQQQAATISNLISQALPQGTKAPTLPDPIGTDKNRITVIPYQSGQAHVTMGHIAIARDDPDRVALEVANRIFGGGSFNSLLSKELRVKRGLTYSASSSLTTTQVAGVFSFRYSTQQDRLLESIQIAHQTLNDFIQKPITQQQLNETKEGMLYAYPMLFSSNANINAQIASIGFYGLDTNYLNTYQKALSNITLKEVTNAIQRHLHADKLNVVVLAQDTTATQIEAILNQNLGLEPISKEKNE